MKQKINVFYNKKEMSIQVKSILYIVMNGNIAYIHTTMGKIYTIRSTLSKLEEELGEAFITVKRGCLVSVMAIHRITETKIELGNGEELDYSMRKRAEIIESYRRKQKMIINGFCSDGTPKTFEEFREHYRVFEELPIAFTDIEMIFDEECRAIDWVFRYGNHALERLEKTPLKKLIGRQFGELFPKMDSKWLRSYERATLYGETLRVIDYSPEINTYLDIICFPTFDGHCGCIMFDISEIKSYRKSTDSEKAMIAFIESILRKK